MKKRTLIILLSLFLLGCDNTFNNSLTNNTSSSSLVNESSSEVSNISEDKTNHLVSLKYDDINTNPLSNEKLLTIDKTSYTRIGSYSTGNYSNHYDNDEMTTIDGVTFEHYRATTYSQGLLSLRPYHGASNDNTIPGALYNTTRIENISRLILNYSLDETTENGLNLYYGQDVVLDDFVTIKGNIETSSVELSFKDVNYFKIETIANIVNLENVLIFYTSENISSSSSYLPAGQKSYRLNPVVFEGDLIDGESSVEVPIAIKVNDDGTYTITETKKYTYYSYEYVSNHQEIATEATMVEPMDVANYYIAFKQAPANYFKSASSAIKNGDSLIFGDNIRQVSKNYSRTDGYVRSIPYNKNNLSYVEFDIDVGNTYITNGRVSREVGRVVIFNNGFDYEGYDNSPVAVLTDDHYATFKEYYNNGLFGERFNVQTSRTNYVWGSATTLK